MNPVGPAYSNSAITEKLNIDLKTVKAHFFPLQK